jgi:nucleoside-diphosphate-sugar epimerase
MATVLVTGGAGFIGAHLVRRLVGAGKDVIVLDNMKRGKRERLADLERAGKARVVVGDIRRLDDVAPLVRGCEAVFHLAAQSNVMGATDDPDYSVTTNVNGTCNVLRAAATAKVARVVFTSSREVYGDPAKLPVGEADPLRPKNAYGASKAAGEAYCRAFAASHGLAVEILRLANVYGPGDRGRVIPLWLDLAREGRDLPVYGGQQVIDFLWVGTAVEALLLASERGLPGPVNVGSGTATKILELAERILAITRSKSKVALSAAREIEVARFVADTRCLRSLGLTPEPDPLQHLAELVASTPSRPGESAR